jgi:signal transduction histidine kinase
MARLGKIRGVLGPALAVAACCLAVAARAAELPALGVLEDREQRLTVEEVAASAGRFRPLGRGQLDAGFTRSAFWLRFELPAAVRQGERRILEAGTPIVDRIDLFVVAPDGAIASARSGDALAYRARAYLDRRPAFVLTPSRDGPRTILLRVASESAMVVPVRLWDEAAFRAAGEDGFYGAYFGFLAALLGYNLFLFVAVRERSYLWYCAFMGSTMLLQAQMTGFADRFLWPDTAGLANPVNLGALAALLVFGLAFTRSYFRGVAIGRTLPPLIVSAQVGLALIALAYPLLTYRVAIQTTMGMALAVIALTIWAIAAGIRASFGPSWFILASFAALVPGGIVHMARVLGLVEGSFLVGHALEVSTAAEALLLSIALAARINTIESERRRSAAALAALERRLPGALIEAQEGEKRRIAAELHDAVGQNLVVVGSRARALLTRTGGDAAPALAEIAAISRETLDQVRGLAGGLHPVELDRLGLAAALARMIERALVGTTIAADLRLEPLDGAVAPEHRIHLYRIVQEAATNAVKHSGADTLSVALRAEGGRVALTIADNGRGFDPAAAAGGLGLATMRQRAALIGAELGWASGAAGTRLELSLARRAAP